MSEQGFSVRLSARIDGYLAAMEQAKKATKETAAAGGTDFARLGGKMQDVGTTLSTHVTLPIIAVGGIAVKMSSDFESAFQRMVGLAGVEADEVDGLKKSVLDLAGQTAKSPQELADALYEASSAGLDTAQAMDAVKVAAKASAVGMGSARDIVGLVASATAAYGSENITAARATDILTASIRAGRADPTELAGTLGRVLPIANQLGVSFEQVGGATAYLSNVFGDTNRTVTALQGFLVKLVSPTAQGRQALLDMGTSAEDLRAAIDQHGLLGALDLLKTHGFEDNAQAMAKLFDDIEGRQGALALMADESGNLASVMGQVADSAGSLDEAFVGVTDTAGFKMKQAWAEVQVALIKAGDIILPIVSGVAGAIGDLAGVFSELPGPVQTIIIGFLGLAAAAGPVLMVGGTLIKNLKEIRTAMTTMAAGATTAALALGAISLVVIGATAIYSDNAAKKAHLRDVTNQFADALKAEADGQQGAVKAAIAAQLANKDLVASAERYGISIDDMAAIVTGKTVPAFEAMRREAEQTPSAFNAIHGNLEAGAFLKFADDLGVVTKGLAGAKEEATLAAKVTDELGTSTERTAGQVTAQTDAYNKMRGIVGDVTQSEAELQAATDLATAATDAYQRHNDSMANDVQRGLDLIEQGWDRLHGTIDDDKTWINLQGGFDQVRQKAQEAFKAASEGADDAEQKGRDYKLSIDDQKQAVIDYGKEVLGLPKEQVSKLLAEIDRGSFDHVEAELANITRNRNISLDIQLKGGSGNFSIVPNTRSASGRFVPGGSNLYSSLGEVSGPSGDEVVLPVGNQSALQAMLSDPRAGVPISAALLGLVGGKGMTAAAGPSVINNNATVNNNHQPVTVDVINRALAMARLAA